MLDEDFRTLGFGDKQKKVYLDLLESGKVNATSLSKRTGIPRATLYSVLEDLSSKGVVSREQTKQGSLYFANSLNSFQRIVEVEEEQVQKKKSAAFAIAKNLEPYLCKSKSEIPKVQVFEGKKSIENMFYEFLPKWRKSYQLTGHPILWGYQDHKVVESYKRWHQHMWLSRSELEQIRLFTNEADIEKELKLKIEGREVKLLPKGVEFSSSIWIYGDYVVMLNTRQVQDYAVQLKDTMIASNLRSIFQLLWLAKY